MEEVQAAVEIAKAPVEIIKVPCEVGEIAVKIGSGTVEALRSAMYFVCAIREQWMKEKVSGETNVDKLMKTTGGDVLLLKVDEAKLGEVKDAMNSWGVLFAEVPDLNVGDGKRELMFPTNAVPRVNMLAEKLGLIQNGEAEVIDNDAYINNATPDKLQEFDEQLQHMQPSAQSLSPGQKRMVQIADFEQCMKDKSLQAFSINTKLVRNVDGEMIESRIPRSDDFVRMPATKVFLRDNDKTYFVFVNPNEQLERFGPGGESKGFVSAKMLYNQHYRTRSWKPYAGVKTKSATTQMTPPGKYL